MAKYTFAAMRVSAKLSRMWLEDHVVEFLDELENSGTYEENPSRYRDFSWYKGSHHASEVTYGGYLRTMFKIKYDYFMIHNESEARQQVKIYVLNYLAERGLHVKEKQNNSKIFLQNIVAHST